MGSSTLSGAGTLNGIRVWDGDSDRGLCSVGWDGDHLTEVDAVTTDAWPEYSLIPGLIDTHVHLLGNAGAQPADFATWPLVTSREEQVLHAVAHAQQAMRRGVTTVRDLAADEAQVALGRAFDAGVLVGPRVLAHGVVGMTAGHNDLFTPPAHPLRKPVADGEDECRKLVRTWARAGMDGIKITTSGGVLSTGDRNGWRNYTSVEIAAIVDEAHALSMRVAAHAHSEQGIEAALVAGVDSIEHGTLLTADQAERVAAAGITVAPTILINEVIAHGRAGVSAEAQEKAAELVAVRDERFRKAAAAGVQFVLGTDANGHHVAFGDQLEEVRRMAELFSYDAETALRRATSAAAATIGHGTRVGTLRVGYGADLLVVKGRPWLDISQLAAENVQAVISRGRLVAGALPD